MLDLSGYTDRREGTRYELQRVLDRVPAERLILLADPKSKNRILEEAIADAWVGMSVESPNAAHPEVPLWIARVDRLVKTVDQERNTTTVELVTSRKETRRLLRAVQGRLSNARPTVREPSTVSPDAVTPGTVTDDVDPWRAYTTSESPPTQSGASNGRAAVVTPTEPTAGDRPSGEQHDDAPRRRRRVPAVGITLAVLVVGVAIASMVILTNESQDSTTTTLATNAESSADCPNPGEGDLVFGDGPCEPVRVAQQKLTDVGKPVAIDGVFSDETREAVMQFQLEHGLDPDGDLGPITWAKLEEVDASS